MVVAQAGTSEALPLGHSSYFLPSLHFHSQEEHLEEEEQNHFLLPSLQVELLVFQTDSLQQSHWALPQLQEHHLVVGVPHPTQPLVTYIPDLSYSHHHLHPPRRVGTLILASSACSPQLCARPHHRLCTSRCWSHWPCPGTARPCGLQPHS